MPITKHNFIVKDVNKLADTVRRAFKIAKEGRPGPVLIDITKDVTANKAEYERKEPEQVKRITDSIKAEDIEAAVKMIEASKKPYVFVGGGAIASGADTQLNEFVHKIDSPVADTLMGKGAFNGTDPLYTGMLGMHGTKASNYGVSQCDLLVVVGARFSDRVYGNAKKFAANAKIAPRRAAPTIPPIPPSTDFFGLNFGAILCFPRSIPTQYAQVSHPQELKKISHTATAPSSSILVWYT